ncbi:MAG TPA: hypothetical protein VJ861_07315 [Treponemataceae bacterium]|nr:hypothetical protein [Treponemataceae bacterium]
MRVALISFCDKQNKKAQSILQKLSISASSKGHQIDFINGLQDITNTRLTMYDYIAVVIKPSALFGSKIPPRVSEFLSSSGSISGKKGCALVIKFGFSSTKTCKKLMKILESQGVKLDYFEVLRDEAHASYAGSFIG